MTGKGLRQKLTNFERKIFGDTLATEVNPKKAFLYLFTTGFLAGSVYGCTGLGAVMSTSDDPKTRLIGNLMYYESAHQDRMEEAREGKTEVNVYHSKEQRQKEKFEPIPTGLFTCNKWVDFDNNGKVIKSELFGLGKKVFNLNKEKMQIRLNNDYEGRVLFRSWTDSGELIGETKVYKHYNKIAGGSTGPNSPNQGDFLDNIKGAGPGNYTITANTEDERTYRIDIKIIE
jgi:hypothetical protein